MCLDATGKRSMFMPCVPWVWSVTFFSLLSSCLGGGSFWSVGYLVSTEGMNFTFLLWKEEGEACFSHTVRCLQGASLWLGW